MPIDNAAPPVDSSSQAVDVTNLSFRYAPSRDVVLNIPRWQVDVSENVFVAGPSGSGKSTLLNLLTGTLSPQTGNIRIMGCDITALSAQKRDKFRAQHIGVVFQQFNLIPYLTVEQNIHAAAFFSGGKKAVEKAQSRIGSLFSHLQLPNEALNKKAGELSVGQQQRVAIARALINSPELLIVDEPTSALDASARDTFMELLLSSAAEAAIIFVSHDKTLSRFFSRQTSIDEISQRGERLE